MNECDLERDLKRINDLPEFEGIVLKDINQLSLLKNTPLHIACIWGDINCIKTLINNGANINAFGEDNYTPLHEAVEQGHQNVVDLLIKKGADISIKDDDGCTPFELAKTMKHQEIIEIFNTLENENKH